MSKLMELPAAPEDPIFGVAKAFAADQREEKVNLGVGIYRTADLKVGLFRSVQEAESRLLQEARPRGYLNITGSPLFVEAIEDLVFGHSSKRVCGAQTVGGTGGLFIVGRLLRELLDVKQLYLPRPTWANHRAIAAAVKLSVEEYAYYNEQEKAFDSQACYASLEQIPEGSAILFHPACHNPTGCDPSMSEWKEILQRVQQRELIPVFDTAYQGLGSSLEKDVAPIRLFYEAGVGGFVVYSAAKNFGLYAERVGALFAMTENHHVEGQIARLIRSTYSNPPAHGAWCVETILRDPELRQDWEGELAPMRGRIQGMRSGLMSGLLAKGGERDFHFLGKQKGLFSFLGLGKDQVNRLSHEFGVYLPASGRINVTGLNSQNLDYVVDAIVSVL